MAAATLPQVKNAGGANVPSEGSLLIDSTGAEKGTAANPLTTTPAQFAAITLAAAVASLAAAGTTAPVTGLISGLYVWAYQLGGTSPSLVLEALGPDGTTYVTIATVTASGTQNVVVGTNATVRLRNAGANPITSLSSNLS